MTFNVAGEEQAKDEDGELVEGVYILPSVDATINVTMEKLDTDVMDAGKWHPAAMVVTGRGSAVGQDLVFLKEGEGSTFTLDLNKESWGNPYMGDFYASLIVCFVNDEMEFYTYTIVDGEDEYEEPVMYEISYTTPNVFPATLLYTSPDGKWEFESFDEAYNHGEIRFAFSNALSLNDDELIGEINYTRFDGLDVDPTDIEIGVNAEIGWNPMDGYYTITVNYALAEVAAKEIKEVEIYLDDLSSPFGVVKVEPVVLENNNPNAKRLAKNTASVEGLAVNNDSVSVYTVTGVLIKEKISMSEVNTLPKGLYIVKGKKVVVK